MIWIQKPQINKEDAWWNCFSVNITKILAFYIWLFIIVVGCIYCWLMSTNLITNVIKGKNDAFQARVDIARNQIVIVLGYSCYWFIIFLFQTLQNVHVLPSGIWKMIPVLFLASRGIWTLGIVLINNWSEIRMCKSYANLSWKEAISISDIQPHVNTKLRSEVILYTKAGIMISIQDESSRSFISRKNSSRFTFDTGDFHFFQFKDRGSSNNAFNNRSSSVKIKVEEDQIDKLLTTDELDYIESRQKNLVLPNIKEGENEEFPKPVFFDNKDNELSMLNKSCDLSDSLLNNSFYKSSQVQSSVYKLEADEGLDWVKKEIANKNQYRSNVDNILNEYKDDDNDDNEENPKSKDNTVPVDSSNMSNSRKFSLVESVRETFKRKPVDHEFHAHLPSQFSKIRKLSSIKDDEYIKSFQNVTQELFSEGKSGSFLYFSR
jgi:hypothetical protein